MRYKMRVRWIFRRRKKDRILVLIIPLTLVYLLLSFKSQLALTLFNLHLQIYRRPSLEDVFPSTPSFIANHIRRIPHQQFFPWSISSNEPLRLNCNRCAVVLNSGHLLGNNYGSDIDAHDCVVRINDAPVGRKFYADVGNRTTVRVVMSEGSRALVHREKHWGERVVHDEIIICLTIECTRALAGIFPNNPIYQTSKSFFKPLLIYEMDRVFETMTSKNMITDRRLNPLPSTGFVGIPTMLNFCEKGIDIYGLSPPDFCQKHPQSNLPYHYYDTVGPESSECAQYRYTLARAYDANLKDGGHVFTAEHLIYDRWRKLRNINFISPQWDQFVKT